MNAKNKNDDYALHVEIKKDKNAKERKNIRKEKEKVKEKKKEKGNRINYEKIEESCW